MRTPGEWKFVEDEGDRYIIAETSEGKVPLFVEHMAIEEDFRFIVRAANTHDDLVAVLKECVAALYGSREVCGNIGNIQHAIDLSEAALRAAGGEK
jgi:hypothetical protein